jgi:hypothetical protein
MAALVHPKITGAMTVKPKGNGDAAHV